MARESVKKKMNITIYNPTTKANYFNDFFPSNFSFMHIFTQLNIISLYLSCFLSFIS